MEYCGYMYYERRKVTTGSVSHDNLRWRLSESSLWFEHLSHDTGQLAKCTGTIPYER